jgi:hypothetical protein
MNSAIYIPDPSILTLRFFETLKDEGFESVDAIENEAGEAVGLRFQTTFGPVEITFMDGEELETHLSGFADWAQETLSEEDAEYVVNRIAHVRMVMACKSTAPDEEALGQFVMSFAMGALGMAMMDGNLLDFTGDFLTA